MALFRTESRLAPSVLSLEDLGVESYSVTYHRQLARLSEIKNGHAKETIFFVEHPDVFTFGRKSKFVPEHLPNAVEVERGGEATFHNPGQLVVYPILELRDGERDLHGYLRSLESVLIETLSHFMIPAESRKGATGVWIKGKEKKIASIGVAIRSWVTFHGIALNVSNDLSGFSKIHPCGFSARVMTSMKEMLGKSCPSMEEVKSVFLTHFEKAFSRSVS